MVKRKRKRAPVRRAGNKRAPAIWLIPLWAVLLVALLIGGQHIIMQNTSGEYVVTAALLNVRDQAGEQIGTLYRGEIIRALDSGNGQTVQIETAYGLTGRVAKRYIARPSILMRAYMATQGAGAQRATLTNEGVRTELERLQKAYPESAKMSVIGQSEWGDDLYALRVGYADAPYSIVVQGGIHAREYATASVVMAQAEDLLRRAQANESYNGTDIAMALGRVNVVFVPLLNPDGAHLCQQGTSAAPAQWRNELLVMNNGINDFSRWKANGAGVDLNANFDARWRIKGDYTQPGSQNYAGPSPLSESETQAFARLVAQEECLTMLCYHSVGEVIYWHFGQEDYAYERDLGMANELARQTGYRAVMPSASGEITSVGGSKDWFVQDYGRPGFTVELFAFGVNKPTLAELQDAIDRNMDAVPYLLDEALHRGVQ